MKKTILIEGFYIKVDRKHVLWKRFEEWYNETVTRPKFYGNFPFINGYYGVTSNGGYCNSDSKQEMEDRNLLFITLEQWAALLDDVKAFYIITPEEAMRIYEIACSDWKKKLFGLWGNSIIKREDIRIEENFYKQMRTACTAEQHTLFDEIFGKYEKPRTFPVNTVLFTKDGRKVGNAIVIGHEGDKNVLKTDYGTIIKHTDYTVRQYFWADFESMTPIEIQRVRERMGPHKNAV